MEGSARLLLELFLMFAGGKLLAELFERLRQPAVVGEILAGVILGPSVLRLIEPGDATRGIAEVGAVFLLFVVGLETQPRELLRHGWTAALVAILGVLFPFAFGFLYVRAASHNLVESIFVGAAMVATSVGITARVLADLGVLETRVARVILGAAVLDDILGMIVLAVVSSLSTGHINYAQLAVTAGEALAFSCLIIFFGARAVGRLRPAVAKLRTRESAFVFAIILCLGLSAASARIGMAAIIGAFLAGLALADSSNLWQLDERARPVYEFLTPFFFVLLGAMVDARGLADRRLLLMVVVVTALAIVGKIIGCGLASLPLGARAALAVGVGMVPRGEVGLIVAAVGLNLHTISAPIYSVVLLMSVLTTLVAPPALRLVLARAQDAPESRYRRS